MCIDRASSGEILAYGIKHGMKTLRLSGLERVRDGISTMEEVLRITKGVAI